MPGSSILLLRTPFIDRCAVSVTTYNFVIDPAFTKLFTNSRCSTLYCYFRLWGQRAQALERTNSTHISPIILHIRSLFYYLIFIGIIVSTGYLEARGQEQVTLPSPVEEITVRFDSLTLKDDVAFSVEGFRDKPREELILPTIEGKEHHFLSVFYSHDITDDNAISILVLPDSSGELLYIDTNNDEDLTNDGPPLLFKRDDPEVVFWLSVPEDSQQVTGRVLQRVPRSVRQDPEKKAVV